MLKTGVCVGTSGSLEVHTCVPMEKVAGMGMPSGVLGPQSWVEFAERTAKRVGIMSYVLWTCGVVLLEHVMGNVSVGLAVALQPLCPHFMRTMGPEEVKQSMRE